MLSPTWVFGVPAALALGAGVLILAVALLHLLGAIGGESPFGASWMIAAGFMISVGHLAGIMALATHFHGVNRGYRKLRPVFRRYADYLTLETMLVGGVLLLFGATAGTGALVYHWQQTGFAALASVLPTVALLTTAAVAIQTILGGFLLAIINNHSAALAPHGGAQ
jgi:hypothetical protein